MESNEAGQATHSLGKSILAPSSYFLILHVFKKQLLRAFAPQFSQALKLWLATNTLDPSHPFLRVPHLSFARH